LTQFCTAKPPPVTSADLTWPVAPVNVTEPPTGVGGSPCLRQIHALFFVKSTCVRAMVSLNGGSAFADEVGAGGEDRSVGWAVGPGAIGAGPVEDGTDALWGPLDGWADEGGAALTSGGSEEWIGGVAEASTFPCSSFR